MGFNAGNAVAPLDWDFSDFDAGKGTTPEPTTEAIQRFHRKVTTLAEALMRLQTATVSAETDRIREMLPEDAKQEMQRWSSLTLDDAVNLLSSEFDQHYSNVQTESTKLVQRYAEAVEEVSGGCPRADQIIQLPHRVRSAYFGWITQELTNPEGGAAGTMRSLGRASSA